MSIFKSCREFGFICCLMLILLDVVEYQMLLGIPNTEILGSVPLEFRANFVLCIAACFLTWAVCDVIFGLIGVIGELLKIKYTRYKFRNPVRVYPTEEK